MKKTVLENLKALVVSANPENVDELTTAIDEELARLAKKATYVSPSDKKKAEENAELYARILAYVDSADKPVGVAEITPAMGTYSAQRITSVVNRLVADHRLIRTYDKRKASYTVNTEWQELPTAE